MRCLDERSLVMLSVGEGTSAQREHSETCPMCGARLRALTGELGGIGEVLRGAPPPLVHRQPRRSPSWSLVRALTIASIRQSLYMARTGNFTHVWKNGSTFVARSHAAGYQQPSGENIAWGYRTSQEVIDAWMASPGHRENILNCDAHSIGTGVAYGDNGLPYYTQVFGYE